jgi:hypothetical protein
MIVNNALTIATVFQLVKAGVSGNLTNSGSRALAQKEPQMGKETVAVNAESLRELAQHLDGMVQMANWQVVLLKDARQRLDRLSQAAETPGSGAGGRK